MDELIYVVPIFMVELREFSYLLSNTFNKHKISHF